MGSPVYNSAILHTVNLHSANRCFVCPTLRSASGIHTVLQISLLLFGFAVRARAADWNGPEQQLARKIVAVTGPGAVAWRVENRSSLGKRDSEVVSNGLRAALEGLGIRFVKPEQAAAAVAVVLSENPSAYVWVAEIQQGAGEAAVVMVSIPRAEGQVVSHDSVPLTLRKIPLWSQDDRILDVAVLEENVTPTQIAVLDPEKVSLYRLRGGKWQLEQSLALSHARPWPRDIRGRLLPARDHLLDAYLPGVLCRSTASAPLTMTCHESDDPWPLVVGSHSGGSAANFPGFGTPSGTPSQVAPMGGFFASTRNFFTGALAPGIGRFTTVSKFYSAAFIPRDKYVLWLFAALDGQVHLVDGITDLTARLGWGSDVASVKTSCGADWQVLATSAADQAGDSVRAYEFPDRNAVPVSAAVDFPGEVTALWTEAKGDTAIAIARNRETGTYEAFRLAMACNQ
jgi:hypothetical protein